MVDFEMLLAAAATYVLAYMCRIRKTHLVGCDLSWVSYTFQSTILKFTFELGFKLLHSFSLILLTHFKGEATWSFCQMQCINASQVKGH